MGTRSLAPLAERTRSAMPFTELPFDNMPREEKSILRQSIIATAHKAHPSKEEMMSGLMQEHVARMELARARQHALEAEQEASRARLAASMEAKECGRLREQLHLSENEVRRLRSVQSEFEDQLYLMASHQEEQANLTSLLADVNCQLEEARVHRRQYDQLTAEQEAKVQQVLEEMDRLRWKLNQQTKQKELAAKEQDRLVQIGLKAQEDHEYVLLCKQREFQELCARLEVNLATMEESNQELRMADNATQQIVGDLKEALQSQVAETQAALGTVHVLEAELESIQKNIWVRKYDPMNSPGSPRSPRAARVVDELQL